MAERAAGTLRLRDHDNEFSQKYLPVVHDGAAILIHFDMTARHQRVRDRHAETAGKAIIAGLCLPQRFVTWLRAREAVPRGPCGASGADQTRRARRTLRTIP